MTHQEVLVALGVAPGAHGADGDERAPDRVGQDQPDAQPPEPMTLQRQADGEAGDDDQRPAPADDQLHCDQLGRDRAPLDGVGPGGQGVDGHPLSLGERRIRRRTEGRHLAQESPDLEEAAQGHPMLVAGQPGLAIVGGVQLGVVPPQRPGGLLTAALRRASGLGGAGGLGGQEIHAGKTMPENDERRATTGEAARRRGECYTLPDAAHPPGVGARSGGSRRKIDVRGGLRHHERALRSVV